MLVPTREKALATVQKAQQVFQETHMMDYWLARTEKALERVQK